MLAGVALAGFAHRAVRSIALWRRRLLSLMIAPAVWAFDTLGHATNGTFPEGGPAPVAGFAGGPGGFGAR